MKLSIVIPVLNQNELFQSVYAQLRRVTDTLSGEVEFLIIDNGSRVPIEALGATVLRNEKSIGVYPTFKQGMENTTGDVVAFFHSDLVIWETMWNARTLKQFVDRPNLGMIGFVGSNEIDASGGRGLGTTSNFQGGTLLGIGTARSWTGSPGSAHGKVSSYFSPAAVVDGCAMILRREAWDDIGYRADWPLHHFYDRLISCQLLEKGWDVGVLGIACDHISGQTVNQESDYHDTAKSWCDANGVSFDGNNWDSTIYRHAEIMFLTEFRDQKHIVPTKRY